MAGTVRGEESPPIFGYVDRWEIDDNREAGRWGAHKARYVVSRGSYHVSAVKQIGLYFGTILRE